MTIYIKNARIIDPANRRDEFGDILIHNGIIAKKQQDLVRKADRVIDAAGLFAIPGLVDMHVHLRDPGQTHKEDIFSGSIAAAFGGITTVAAMPNTEPVVDNLQTIQYILNKAQNAAVRILPVGAMTMGLKGEELSDFESLHKAGAVAFSDDGRPVENTKIMLEALKLAQSLNVPILSHCEDLYLSNGIINESDISLRHSIPGTPTAAEDAATARDVALAASAGCSIHICHVSTKTSLDIIKAAKSAGVRVTCETAPHYFAFSDQCLESMDADYRMNPPLRGEEHRIAVVNAIKDGTIDVIATDHAPHTDEEKSDFIKAPNGVIGMQTSLASAYTCLVKPGDISINRLIELMSVNPAKILNLPYGTLSEGAPADVVLFDPGIDWTVEKDRLPGKSHNTPFKGKKLSGKVVMTICGGRIVYEE
ncbi:MAG TPA: dihydroorotase [Clostridiales bacterium]|nr:dihydroorotase [Clostridiales bacterium]